MPRRHVAGAVTAAALIFVNALAVSAQSLSATAHHTAVPPDMSASVAAALANEGVAVAVGGQVIEFWWVASLPALSWSEMPAGELVGVMRTTAPWREIRGKTIRPGVYTLRYALQPQNGDHLGVSPYREFLVIGPAATDTTAGAVGHEVAVRLSKTTIGGSHPAMISIDPPVADGAPMSSVTTDEGHQAIVVRIPALSKHLSFGIVLIGRIEH